MKKFISSISLLFSSTLLLAQSVTAKVIDVNNDPIVFATVQSSENKGVITNEEGVFTISLEKSKTLTISCLGFIKKEISFEDIEANNFSITLAEAINELGEVFLTNKQANADSIIIKVKQNIENNYKNSLIKHELFSRFSSLSSFNKIDFDLTKASNFKKKQLKGVNASLDSLSYAIKKDKSIYYNDLKGTLFIKNKTDFDIKKDSINIPKLNNLKVVNLVDKNSDFSVNNIQEKSQDIILKYLDKNYTYKLKSGLFKIEDSLSLKDIEEEINDSIYERKVVRLKHNLTNSILKPLSLKEDTFLRKILDTKYYEYQLENTLYINENIVYVILFSPKKTKAKYSGRLYVSDEDFGILKAEYSYAEGKRGEHLNLRLVLGVKFSKNGHSGVILFKKTNDKYNPFYAKEVEESYFYVNRPIKFIENSKDKNKVTFNIKLEGIVTNKNEFLISETDKITQEIFNSIEEKEKITVTELDAYNANIWKNQHVLEPTEAMKNFKSDD